MRKNCTHHHVVIGAANTAATLYSTYYQFSQFLGLVCTNILVLLAQLHQYIGATDIVAPTYWCNLC
jgi:hypothetical protein